MSVSDPHGAGPAHGHDHGRGGHAHRHHGNANERRTFWAALITCAFMVAEAVGGILSGSLALIADAAHMLTDAAALALAWAAFRMARRPATRTHSYGYGRFQILAAFTNGIALLFVTGWIAYEAVARLLEPVEVLSGIMLTVAMTGLVVNIAVFWVLHGADRESLNIRGALLHVMGDLLGSVAAVAAALIIMATGWTAADPILSVFVACLILAAALRLVRDSARILLQATPHQLDPGAIIEDLERNVATISGVHHVHVWSLTERRTIVTLHARLADPALAERAIAEIGVRLKDRFGIDHVTVQVESEAG